MRPVFEGGFVDVSSQFEIPARARPGGAAPGLRRLLLAAVDVGRADVVLSLAGAVSPYTQKRHEDKFWVEERYARVPILGPVTNGAEPVALDPPSPDEVMRALEKIHPVSGNVPLLYEKQRNNVRMTIEPISDYTDPVRVYPLIGPARLHHAHYKCTIYYSDTTRCGYPIPSTTVDEDAREVVYIDHNHFHMVGNVDDAGIGIP